MFVSYPILCVCLGARGYGTYCTHPKNIDISPLHKGVIGLK